LPTLRAVIGLPDKNLRHRIYAIVQVAIREYCQEIWRAEPVPVDLG